jgi:O-glycosyl hydrolase
VKLLVTSRDLPNIGLLFEQYRYCHKIMITAHKADLEAYVAWRIEKNLEFKEDLANNKTLEDHIEKTMSEGYDGK